MNTPFDKLNRLRKVAGMNPLKTWKASQDALQAQINRLEADGNVDPGPDPIDQKAPTPIPDDFIPRDEETGEPVIDFGPNSKADIPPTADEIPALAKDKKLAFGESPKEPARTRAPARLARGVGDDKMGAHCRKAVQDARRAEKAAQEKDKPPKKKLTKKEKKAIKKAKLQARQDGTAVKTTTAGKKRKIGKELNEKIQKASAAKKSGNQADPNNFTVAELARECDMDPKVARAKLRRHENEIKKLHSKGQDRWTFPNTAKKTIKDILCPKK